MDHTAEAAAPLRLQLAQLAVQAGNQARLAVWSISPGQRSQRVESQLKPPPETSAYADVVGEDAILEVLRQYATACGVCVCVIQDVASAMFLTIGSRTGSVVWCYLDAVDGTVKVAGLGNDSSALRIINDGTWGVGIAFTDLTSKSLEDLEIDDFTITAIIDGNPPVHSVFPTAVVAIKSNDQAQGWQTLDYSCNPPQPLFTSSSGNLSQSAVYYDAFQAFDRSSSTLQNEQLAGLLYSKLINRHAGGAFDIWRAYGNLSSLIRCMLGYRPDSGERHEPQCAGFVVLNENLPNMIPSVPIILGAGGMAVTIDGQPLRHRKLVEGRTSICYCANEDIMRCLQTLFDSALTQAASS